MVVQCQQRSAKGLASPAGVVGAGAAARWYYNSVVCKPPEIFCCDTPWSRGILRDCPVLSQPYRPTFWATNPHLQTILAVSRGALLHVRYRRQLIMAPDGGSVALDWLEDTDLPGFGAASSPILLVLHGINGGSHEGYCKWVCVGAKRRGWRAVVLNYRGCNGLQLTSPKGYCGAFTDDVHIAVASIHSRFPAAPLLAAGYSLGSLLLTKYVAEADSQAQPQATSDANLEGDAAQDSTGAPTIAQSEATSAPHWTSFQDRIDNALPIDIRDFARGPDGDADSPDIAFQQGGGGWCQQGRGPSPRDAGAGLCEMMSRSMTAEGIHTMDRREAGLREGFIGIGMQQHSAERSGGYLSCGWDGSPACETVPGGTSIGSASQGRPADVPDSTPGDHPPSTTPTGDRFAIDDEHVARSFREAATRGHSPTHLETYAPGTELQNTHTASPIRRHDLGSTSCTASSVRGASSCTPKPIRQHSTGSREVQGSGLVAAVMVSNPFCLKRSNQRMASPWSLAFAYNLLISYMARQYLKTHQADLAAGHTNLDMAAALESWTMQHIEQFLVVQGFGYSSVDDYYLDGSSQRHIPSLRTPCLFLASWDDPLLGMLPEEECRQNPHTMLAVTSHGGHVAFLEGMWPLGPSWMDRAALDFLAANLQPPSHGSSPIASRL